LRNIGKHGPGVQAFKQGMAVITPMMVGCRVEAVDNVDIHSGGEFWQRIAMKTQFDLKIHYDEKTSKFLDIIKRTLKITKSQLRNSESRKKMICDMHNPEDPLRETFFHLLKESASIFTDLRTQIHDIFNTICARYKIETISIAKIMLSNDYDTYLDGFMQNAPDLELKPSEQTDFLKGVLRLIDTVNKGKEELPDDFLKRAHKEYQIGNITHMQATEILKAASYHFEEACKVPWLMKEGGVDAAWALKTLVEFKWDKEKSLEVFNEKRRESRDHRFMGRSPTSPLPQLPFLERGYSTHNRSSSGLACLRFDCFQSDPLILNKEHFDVVQDDAIVPAALDFSKENSIIETCLVTCNFNIEYDISVLTRKNLFSMKCHILHLSGHGDPGTLILEDGRGGVQFCDEEAMDRMNLCEANPNLKLVFVSMCHSEAVAQKFVKMGIPHVIAVANAEKVKDQTAISFTEIFYNSFLSNGLTVQAAFNCAVEYIDIQDKECPMKLLPEDGNHNLVFAEIYPELQDVYNPDADRYFKRQRIKRLVPQSAIPNLDFQKSIDHFTIYHALNVLKSSRLVAIYSPPYVGREEVTAFTAYYTHRLSHFPNGVFYVSFNNPISSKEEFYDRMATTINNLCEDCSIKPNFDSITTFIMNKHMAFFFSTNNVEVDDFLPEDEGLRTEIVDIIAQFHNSTKAASFCICISMENYSFCRKQPRFFDRHKPIRVKFMERDIARQYLLRGTFGKEKKQLYNASFFEKKCRLPLTPVIIDNLRNFFLREKVKKVLLEHVLKNPRAKWEAKIAKKLANPELKDVIVGWYERIEMLRPYFEDHLKGKEKLKASTPGLPSATRKKESTKPFTME